MQAPRVVEHLAPFVGGLDGELPVVDAHRELGRIARRLGLGVEQEHVAGAFLRPPPHDHLPAIGGQRELAHVGEEQLGHGAIVFQRQRLQRGLLLGARFGLEQPQPFGVHAQVGVVAGRQRHLLQALGEPVPDDRGHGRLRHRCPDGPAGRRAGRRRLGFRRLQFVGGPERKAVARLQRQGIDALATIEIRAHVAVAPRGILERQEVAAGDEPQPVSVRPEGGRRARVARRGHHVAAAIGDPVQHDLVPETFDDVGRFLDGQGLAVRRPRQVPIELVLPARRGAAIEQFILAAGDIQQPQASVLVVVGDPATVRRRHRLPADHVGAAGQLAPRAAAVGRQQPQLVLAAGVRHRQHVLAIGHEHGVAQSAGGRLEHVDATQRAHARQRDVAVRRERDAIAPRRHGQVGELLQRMLDPLLAQLVEVGRQRDRHRRGGAIGQVEHMQGRALLIDDAIARDRRRAHLEVAVTRQLAQVAAAPVHGPQIGHAVMIRQEHDAVAPGHRIVGVAVGRARQRLRLGIAAQRVVPQRGRESAAIAAKVVADQAVAREHELARVDEDAVTRIGQGHPAERGSQRRNDGQLRLAQRACLECRDQDLALGRPAAHLHALAAPRQAPGDAAGQRHDVDLAGAVVGRGVGERLAIRRDGRAHRVAGPAGQSHGRSAGRRGAPQVAFGGEDHGVAVHARIARIAGGGLRRAKRRKKQQCCRDPESQSNLPGLWLFDGADLAHSWRKQ